MAMKVRLQLSCYNGSRYLPYVFASLKAQTFTDWRLVVTDNGSRPEELGAIKKAITEAGFEIDFHRIEKNVGFAGAHNFLFGKHGDAEYVQLLNDDAILEPEYLARMVEVMDVHPEYGSAEGKIYRWDFENVGNAVGGRTMVIDTMGLVRTFYGKVMDDGAGMDEKEWIMKGEKMGIDKDAPFEVFGVSGCLPMYRVGAVREVSMDGSLFDGSYVSYKEDVDIAYRMRAAGYIAAAVPMAVAYHRRSLRNIVVQPSTETSYQSLRNHLWLSIVHYRWLDRRPRFLAAWFYEFGKSGYWLLRRPSFVVQLLRDTWLRRKHLVTKRRFVQELRHIASVRPDFAASTPRYDVAVVTVTHNDLSEAALVSVRRMLDATKLRVAYVVPDNTSTKFAANELVQAHVPEAYVLLRDGDFGYGRSSNRGAKEVEADYYFILNPDTDIIDPLIVDKLYAHMKANPDCGVAAPKIFYFDGRLQETCRRFPAWYMPLIQRTGLKNTRFGKRYADSFNMMDDDHNRVRDVDWAQGSALFVDRNVWRRLGGFDHRYWMYFEDIDLCRRTWNLGKRVTYVADVHLKHAQGKQSAKYAGFIKNFFMNPMARAHVVSWLKYTWKWNIHRAPSTDR